MGELSTKGNSAAPRQAVGAGADGHCGDFLVMGLAGQALTGAERAFVAANRPAGIILFSRNIGQMARLQALVAEIRASADPSPTLWIDQEGGRVQRLRAPLTGYPSPGRFSALEARDPEAALRLARTAGRLNGRELAALGVGVNCAPVLDIRQPDADPVILDRAFGEDPEQVARLAGAWLEGFQPTGVLAMGKHFPGHGAAQADSHKALPTVAKAASDLTAWELAPFAALLDRLPALMTAHLIATGLDPVNPATWSPEILHGLLRGKWGYRGLIVSDALEMGALAGAMKQRARRALAAGCDLLLCCTGRLSDAAETLAGIQEAMAGEPTPVGEEWAGAARRIRASLDPHRIAPGDLDALLADAGYRADRAELEALVGESASLVADPTDAGS